MEAGKYSRRIDGADEAVGKTNTLQQLTTLWIWSAG